jgi:hypothetical protein
VLEEDTVNSDIYPEKIFFKNENDTRTPQMMDNLEDMRLAHLL